MLTKSKTTHGLPQKKLRFSGLPTEVFTCYLQVANQVQKKMYALFQKDGLTDAQFFTLMAIYHAENNKLTLSDISRILLVSRANITGVIQRLEERDLIVKVSDKKDLRLIYVKLSSAGEKIVKKIRPHYIRCVKTIFSNLQKNDLLHFYKLLAKMKV